MLSCVRMRVCAWLAVGVVTLSAQFSSPYDARLCLSVRTYWLMADGAPRQTSTIPWVCCRRRNQWLRLALVWYGSGFILFDLACTCCVPYVEATVLGVGVNIGSDDCNDDDGRTSPRSAIAMERGEASTVRKCARIFLSK